MANERFRVIEYLDGMYGVQDLSDDYIHDERFLTRAEAEGWIQTQAHTLN